MSKIKLSPKFSKTQLIILVSLRIVIGYHFLFEGVNKLFIKGWSSYGFLLDSKWIFSDIFQFIGNSETLLLIVDQINIWAQILIGVSLILGLGVRIASFIGAGLLLLYYIANPPFLQNILFVDRNLIELFAILVVAVYNTSNVIGLDVIVNKIRYKENG